MTTTRLPTSVSNLSTSRLPSISPASSVLSRKRPSAISSATNERGASAAGSIPMSVTPRESRSLMTTAGTRTRVLHATTCESFNTAMRFSSGVGSRLLIVGSSLKAGL